MARTILLTGATGFLGSHICERLINEGNSVVILKRKSSNTWRIKHLLNQLTVYDQDKINLTTIFRECDIGAIIHTSTSYGKNGEKTHEIFQSNVIFPLLLLDTSVDFSLDMFINTDTVLSKYTNFYSMSKAHYSDILKIYAKNIRIFNLKLENVYGEKDGLDKLISNVIVSFLRKQDSILLTEGTQDRDFIYIDDVVAAYIKILKKGMRIGEGYTEYSIGSGISVSIREIVELIRKLTFNTVTKTDFGAVMYRENELMHSVADLTKIRDEMNWTPQFDLVTGLKRTIKWYRERYYQLMGDG